MILYTSSQIPLMVLRLWKHELASIIPGLGFRFRRDPALDKY